MNKTGERKYWNNDLDSETGWNISVNQLIKAINFHIFILSLIFYVNSIFSLQEIC